MVNLIFNGRKKILSSGLEILMSAANFEEGRRYLVSLARNDIVIISSGCQIKDFDSPIMDRKQWALLLSEIRTERNNDL